MCMSRDLWWCHMHKEEAAYVLCYSDWAEREKPKQLFIGTVAVLPLLVEMWRSRLRMDMDAFGVGLGCAGCNIMHQLLWGPRWIEFWWGSQVSVVRQERLTIMNIYWDSHHWECCMWALLMKIPCSVLSPVT